MLLKTRRWLNKKRSYCMPSTPLAKHRDAVLHQSLCKQVAQCWDRLLFRSSHMMPAAVWKTSCTEDLYAATPKRSRHLCWEARAIPLRTLTCRPLVQTSTSTHGDATCASVTFNGYSMCPSASRGTYMILPKGYSHVHDHAKNIVEGIYTS